MALHHADLHYALDEAVPHIRQSRVAVQASLVFHLHDAVLQQLLLILIQLQLPQYPLVALNELGGSEPRGDPRLVGVILDHMYHCVNAPVHRRIRGTKVVHLGQGLPTGGMHRLIQKLRHALALRGADRHHRDTQTPAQLPHINGTAVGVHLVHHIQSQHHGHPQLQKLQRQVEVALNVGGVNDIDNAIGLFIENKIPGDNLLLGIGPQGVDTRQIHHRTALAVLDLAHFLIHRHAGEIAHMLIGAGKRIKEGGFAAILIANQCKNHSATSSTSIFLPSSTRRVSS